MEKMIGSQVVRINKGKAIVKCWMKEADKLGMPIGKTKISYDVYEYQDGGLGRRIMGFVTARAAVKYLFGGGCENDG